MTRQGPLTGTRVLAVLAHPDDESLACGATLAWCAAEGARVSLLCATRGEGGERVPGADDEVALGTVRRGELNEAAQILGIEEVILLDHPDGYLPGENFALFRQEMVLAIRHVQPDIVITFGPDGLYWHPDHIYVYERVTEAVSQFGPGAPALYYVVLPPGLMRTILDLAQSNPGSPEGLHLWHMDPDAFGAYAPLATVSIDAAPYVDQKLRALQAHRSQVGRHSPFRWLTPDQSRQLVGQEHYVRAPLGNTESQVLEGLAARQGAPKAEAEAEAD